MAENFYQILFFLKFFIPKRNKKALNDYCAILFYSSKENKKYNKRNAEKILKESGSIVIFVTE